MTRITIKELQAQLAEQEAELADLKRDRDQLKAEVSASQEEGSLRIVTDAQGMSPEELFLTAAEGQSFVTYGAVAQSLGLGERFLPSMMKEVIAFIETNEVDHLVVNRHGKYGAGAPLTEHHAKLKDLGYTEMPEQGQRRKKKAKVDDTVALAATVAAVIKALQG